MKPAPPLRLTLLRHAQADPELPGSKDWQRALTRRGELDAKQMGQRLKQRYGPPPLILSSPAIRARQTSEIVAKHFARTQIEFVDDLYLASPLIMLSSIQQHGESFTHLLVVGHNPGISELANELNCERAIEGMPTASFVSMEFAMRTWRELLPATGINVEFDYPQRPA
jgi:phosphohistidine phosphatase